MSDNNDDECIHGMYPASSCTLCNGKSERAQREADSIEYEFVAKFRGACQRCRDFINPGEEMARTGDGRLVCRDCLADLR